MRVSVWFANGKLLIPVGDGTGTIASLIQEFSTRYSRREGGGKQIHVKELQTKTGDSLDPTDLIKDILEDNAELVAITDGPESGKAASSSTASTSNPNAKEVAIAVLDEAEKRKAQEEHVCVQCHKMFKEAENGDGHCRFHEKPSERRGWRNVNSCCGGDVPCKGGRHRSEHHTDYQYSEFFVWAAQMREQIKSHWIDEERVDFEDEWKKSADLGVMKDGNIYLRIYRGNYLKYFKVIELESIKKGLLKAANEANKHSTIHQWTDSEQNGCFVEFFWTENGIGLTLKMASDQTPTEKIALFGFSATAIPQLLGVKTVIEKASYAFPTASQLSECASKFKKDHIRTGLEFPAQIKIVPTTYPCEGDSCLKLETTDRLVEANQDLWCREGKFGQYIISVLKVINSSDKEMSISSVSSEFKLGASFTPSLKTFLGVPDNRGGHYFPEEGLETVHLQPHDTVILSFSAMIKVEGEPGDRNETRMRAAPGLPQPLKVRYTIKDAEGKQVSIVTEQVNPPLNLATKESCEESWKRGKIIGWFACDDLQESSRKYVAFYLNGCGNLVVRMPGTYHTLTDSDLELIVFKARKAGTSEYPLENMKSETINISALVDCAQGFVWGFRVKITTKTGSLEDTFQFPDMAQIQASFSLRIVTSPLVVKPGSEIEVSWTTIHETDCDTRLLLFNAANADGSDYEAYENILGRNGTVKMTAPAKEGTYDLRLISEGVYSSSLAKSSTFVVSSK